MRTHTVTFYSPGSFTSEQTTKTIDAWDPVVAVALSKGIVERHEARPYAFRFTTSLVHDPMPDGEGGLLNVQPRAVESSGMFFLGGMVLSLEGIKARAKPGEEILLSNMRGNGWAYVVETTNGYTHTAIFAAEDRTVDEEGAVVERGDDPERMAYRAKVEAGA